MNSETPGGLLGQSERTIQTNISDEIGHHLVNMLQQARDSVRLSSPLLNPTMFNREDFRSVLSQFARRSRNAQVRLLVRNAKVIGQRGHRLLELSRRMSTSVVMRKLELAEHEIQREYLLVDDCGVIEFGAMEKDPATIQYCDRARHKTLREQFDTNWHKSRSPIELRRLVI